MSTETRASFGALLKSYRLGAGLTQEALAEQSGVSVRGIQNLERGGHRPLRDTLERLTTALELDGQESARFLSEAAPLPRRRGSASSSVALARPGALPTPPTALVGRAREGVEVDALLRRDDLRVVTLVGPGGVGKTRLALHAAHVAQERFADGAVFVDLTPLRDPALVLLTVAQALGLLAQGSRPAAEVLAAHLRDRHLLLVLDNCEQVAEAAVDVAALRAACPGLRVLATSRAALRVRGEQVYAVPPLATPDLGRLPPLDALGAVAAVALFVQQARAADYDFALNPGNAAAVAAICARLDGLPLALELAAARLEALPPAALLARLERPLEVLVAGPRDAPARQQTLRDTIAWSYKLLSPPGRALFRRLAPVTGGCTLAAARAIRLTEAAGDPRAGADVAENLALLAEARLLRVDVGGDEEPRYAMLATIREYALEQLEEAGETDDARRRHATYYLALAEDAQTHFHDAGLPLALDLLDAELDNLRAALAWCAERGDAGDGEATECGLSVAAALYPFWHIRPHLREGGAWLERLLATPGATAPTSGRVRALAVAGLVAGLAHDAAATHARAEEALALGRALDDPLARAYGLRVAGGFLLSLRPGNEAPDPLAARAFLEEGLALFQAVGPPGRWEIATSLIHLGMVSVHLGDIARAEGELARSLAVVEDSGALWPGTMALDALGGLAWARGDIARARACYERLIPAAARLGNTQTVANARYLLGQLAEEDGDTPAARACYTHALTLVRAAGDFALLERGMGAIAIRAVAAGQEAPRRAIAFAAATFGAPQTGGRPLTIEQALDAALLSMSEVARSGPSRPAAGAAAPPHLPGRDRRHGSP